MASDLETKEARDVRLALELEAMKPKAFVEDAGFSFEDHPRTLYRRAARALRLEGRSVEETRDALAGHPGELPHEAAEREARARVAEALAAEALAAEEALKAAAAAEEARLAEESDRALEAEQRAVLEKADAKLSAELGMGSSVEE